MILYSKGDYMKITLLLLSLFLSFSAFARVITLTSENSVSIKGVIDGSSTSHASMELFRLCKNNKSLYLVLDTPGGSVGDGRTFIDFVKGLPCKVDTITIFAASMGYQIVQALEKRYITPSGVLMSHRGSLNGVGGQLPGEIESRLAFYKEYLNEMDIAVAKRVGISVKEYKELIRDELWLPAPRAIGLKHADEEVLVRCDSSLSGTKEIEVPGLFSTSKVTVSACPLINGPVDIEQQDSLIRTKEIWLP